MSITAAASSWGSCMPAGFATQLGWYYPVCLMTKLQPTLPLQVVTNVVWMCRMGHLSQ
jgi:hypothetical protein